jgi:hypothetical protein
VGFEPTGMQNLKRVLETGGTVKSATELNGTDIGHGLDMRDGFRNSGDADVFSFA